MYSAVSNHRIKCRHWSCWQKLLISFAPVGADVLPVPSSPPIMQSHEAAAFSLSFMKYSHFVWPPVTKNLFHFTFCFISFRNIYICLPIFFCLLASLLNFWLNSLSWAQGVLSIYGSCFLVSCAGSFPECKLWMKNTFSVLGDGSYLASSETAVCNSSSGCTADSFHSQLHLSLESARLFCSV